MDDPPKKRCVFILIHGVPSNMTGYLIKKTLKSLNSMENSSDLKAEIP
jgi:hypothetical protein